MFRKENEKQKKVENQPNFADLKAQIEGSDSYNDSDLSDLIKSLNSLYLKALDDVFGNASQAKDNQGKYSLTVENFINSGGVEARKILKKYHGTKYKYTPLQLLELAKASFVTNIRINIKTDNLLKEGPGKKEKNDGKDFKEEHKNSLDEIDKLIENLKKNFPESESSFNETEPNAVNESQKDVASIIDTFEEIKNITRDIIDVEITPVLTDNSKDQQEQDDQQTNQQKLIELQLKQKTLLVDLQKKTSQMAENNKKKGVTQKVLDFCNKRIEKFNLLPQQLQPKVQSKQNPEGVNSILKEKNLKEKKRSASTDSNQSGGRFRISFSNPLKKKVIPKDPAQKYKEKQPEVPLQEEKVQHVIPSQQEVKDEQVKHAGVSIQDNENISEQQLEIAQQQLSQDQKENAPSPSEQQGMQLNHKQPVVVQEDQAVEKLDNTDNQPAKESTVEEAFDHIVDKLPLDSIIKMQEPQAYNTETQTYNTEYPWPDELQNLWDNDKQNTPSYSVSSSSTDSSSTEEVVNDHANKFVVPNVTSKPEEFAPQNDLETGDKMFDEYTGLTHQQLFDLESNGQQQTNEAQVKLEQDGPHNQDKSQDVNKKYGNPFIIPEDDHPFASQQQEQLVSSNNSSQGKKSLTPAARVTTTPQPTTNANIGSGSFQQPKRTIQQPAEQLKQQQIAQELLNKQPAQSQVKSAQQNKPKNTTTSTTTSYTTTTTTTKPTTTTTSQTVGSKTIDESKEAEKAEKEKTAAEKAATAAVKLTAEKALADTGAAKAKADAVAAAAKAASETKKLREDANKGGSNKVDSGKTTAAGTAKDKGKEKEKVQPQHPLCDVIIEKIKSLTTKEYEQKLDAIDTLARGRDLVVEDYSRYERGLTTILGIKPNNGKEIFNNPGLTELIRKAALDRIDKHTFRSDSTEDDDFTDSEEDDIFASPGPLVGGKKDAADPAGGRRTPAPTPAVPAGDPSAPLVTPPKPTVTQAAPAKGTSKAEDDRRTKREQESFDYADKKAKELAANGGSIRFVNNINKRLNSYDYLISNLDSRLPSILQSHPHSRDKDLPLFQEECKKLYKELQSGYIILSKLEKTMPEKKDLIENGQQKIKQRLDVLDKKLLQKTEKDIYQAGPGDRFRRIDLGPSAKVITAEETRKLANDAIREGYSQPVTNQDEAAMFLVNKHLNGLVVPGSAIMSIEKKPKIEVDDSNPTPPPIVLTDTPPGIAGICKADSKICKIEVYSNPNITKNFTNEQWIEAAIDFTEALRLANKSDKGKINLYGKHDPRFVEAVVNYCKSQDIPYRNGVTRNGRPPYEPTEKQLKDFEAKLNKNTNGNQKNDYRQQTNTFFPKGIKASVSGVAEHKRKIGIDPPPPRASAPKRG